MAKHIFISYSRKDTEFVDKLSADIEKAGHKTWVDRPNILGGDKWRRQIVNAIGKATAVLIVLSPSSVGSDNVRKEIDITEQKKITKILIDIEKHEIPDDFLYQVAGEQKIDFKRDYQTGLGNLLRTLGALGSTSSSVLFIYHPQERSVAEDIAGKISSTLKVNTILAPIGFEVGSQEWIDQFEKDVKAAKAAVILVSKRTKDDEWVIKRISYAKDQGISVIPVQIEDLGINDIPPEIGYYQRIMYRHHQDPESKFIVKAVEAIISE